MVNGQAVTDLLKLNAAGTCLLATYTASVPRPALSNPSAITTDRYGSICVTATTCTSGNSRDHVAVGNRCNIYNADMVEFVTNNRCCSLFTVHIPRSLHNASHCRLVPTIRGDLDHHLIATQRGMAMTYLTGYSQALARLGVWKEPAVRVEGSGM